MIDRLKELAAKILAWWNKFTAKQKTIIVSITAVVIFTFAIIIYVFSRPKYIELRTCENSTEAAKVISILDGAGIRHKESDDLLIIQVEQSQQTLARYALASSGYTSNNPQLSDFMDTSMSTTASDRERQYKEFMEAQLEDTLSVIGVVDSAQVILDIPPQNGTLAAEQEESSAYIQLTLNGPISDSNSAAMAKAAATCLGNPTTANITILDQDGNILFAGGDDYTTAGAAHSILELQNQAESMVANQVKKALLGTNQFRQVTVVSHLQMDYAEYEKTIHEYYANEGYTEGLHAEIRDYESESTGGTGGPPGTDSNDDDNNNNTYVWQDYNNTESSTTEREELFLPNESIETRNILAGSIVYDDSSIAVALISHREYHEESVRRQGLLDGGLTWEEFKDNNGADILLEVDDGLYDMVANATGISRDRISIVAYETPVFYDREGWSAGDTNMLVSVLMLLLILGLLAFVVLRSMRAKKSSEEEEELSVENMLQSTAESTLEDIDLESKSETRLLIERFVDENPEAAANLLRNWLNEDWD